MNDRSKGQRILALYPQRRGLAYALLDNHELRAYGTRWARSEKARKCLRAAEGLAALLSPDLIAIEDAEDPSLRRCSRIERLLKSLLTHLEGRGFELRPLTRAMRGYAFRGRDVKTKDDRALLIAQLYPVLQRRLPPRREIWMPESESMGIFDATTLALTLAGVPEGPRGEGERFKRILEWP